MIQRTPRDNPFGAPVWWVDSTGSTQDEVFTLAEDGAPDGTAVQAGHQSAGRGRLTGRVWESPPGVNLTFSFLTRLSGTYPLSLLWGLGTARFLESLGVSCEIKWPNDILVESKKICGILVQAKKNVQVTGIGFNVGQVNFPPDLRRPGTSLVLQGISMHPDKVMDSLLPWLKLALDDPYPGLEVEKRLWNLGKEVTVTDPWTKENITGIIRGLGPQGELLLETPGGMRSLAAGELG